MRVRAGVYVPVGEYKVVCMHGVCGKVYVVVCVYRRKITVYDVLTHMIGA